MDPEAQAITPATHALWSGRAETLSGLQRLLEVVGHMNGSEGLAETLEAVARGIVVATGFQAVVINYMRADGLMEITTVVGPDEVKGALLGKEVDPGDLVREMGVAESWGRLRFLRHGVVPIGEYQWIPDIPVPTDPDGWHPGDDLLVPLYATSRELIGIVSVDMPYDGMLPDANRRQLLEMLAMQAEIAINNARLTQRLQASEASLRLAFDVAAVGMALVSLDQRTPLRILRGNAVLSALANELGRTSLDGLSDLLDADDTDHDASTWLPALGLDGRTRVLKRVTHDGIERWLEVTGSALPLHSTESPQAIVQVEDITARRQAELDAREAASRDQLTGLKNRSGLLQQLAEMCQRSAAAQTMAAVLFCDLDGFKDINDTLGHSAGDAVLVTCASRLASLVRGTDQAYRVGGDEFVVLIDDITPFALESVVQRIRATIEAPQSHEGHLLNVGISVGWAMVDGRTQDVARILAAADAAMYADKRAKIAPRLPAQYGPRHH
ncbi:MAG: diguanylate cyclase domain-containing protein [Actinomycetales bacterium]